MNFLLEGREEGFYGVLEKVLAMGSWTSGLCMRSWTSGVLMGF